MLKIVLSLTNIHNKLLCILIEDNFRKTVLLGCIYKWQQNTLYVLLVNDCSIRVYQSFDAIFKKIIIGLALCLMLLVTHYAQNYAGIIGWSLSTSPM